MADEQKTAGGATEREPRGFSEHTRKSAGEFAHEQGWGLNEEGRTKLPEGKQAWEGGTDYDYGAQDFGDLPVDTSAAEPSPEAAQVLRKGAESESGPGRNSERRAG